MCWNFSWYEDSLLLQLKDDLGEDAEVIYVGCLKEEIELLEQDDVAQTLIETFKCVPAFIPPKLFTEFYHGLTVPYGKPVNKIFADKVMEVITPNDDFVLVHDYHLMNAGVSYQSKRGYIGLEYYGRTVSIKILPVGIHMGQVHSVLGLPETESKVTELQNKFKGWIILLGVDDMDIFKGISLKLLAIEQLLTQHPEKRECCLVTAIRDGMNLIPYEYVVCRRGIDNLHETLGLDPSMPKKSMLVISEFIGCSPSFSGVIRVNPWNIDAVAEAMDLALKILDLEKQMVCKDHVWRRCWGIGFGLGFHVITLDPSFRKPIVEHIVSAYKRTKSRAILLDYDGTLQSTVDTGPNVEAIAILNKLSRDSKNVVFIVSGKNKDTLTQWFSSCGNLCLAAEHGYFAKDFLDHLESVLANEPVSVKSGQHIVEVKPQGVNKGLVAARLLVTMRQKEVLPHFILCVGDCPSDEDIFEVIMQAMTNESLSPVAEVFACTIGQKPSKAKY
ncbi:alpha,alpha-trehalose-phosphate synthase [udp-forming] 5 [Olea europaea subsp. europaea]|uniref:Alpha,alpha-trehalose-phosphate synthase [udp-forming] 5 n=1 Tax=Olea europaea subsp. europaea TaxID=158383 RepID=A0A8S0T210_OLEEU|nr:alpha,alpha-trehalose-phosphate synthase [udp-forming] 5 [Olea europaea subsp. europaea]